MPLIENGKVLRILDKEVMDMNKKVLIYGILFLAVAAIAFAIAICRPKTVGLSTGTPSQLSQGKTSSAELEDNIEAKGVRGRRYIEDAG